MVERIGDVHPAAPVVHQQPLDEVASIRRVVGEEVLVELPLAFADLRQGLPVVLAAEQGPSGQEEVRQDADGPHVGSGRHSLAIHHLRSDEFGHSCQHSKTGIFINDSFLQETLLSFEVG